MLYLQEKTLQKIIPGWRLFYSVRAFARIRQTLGYFSKYWGDGCMGRPQPKNLGGPSPQSPPRSPPVGLPLKWTAHRSRRATISCQWLQILNQKLWRPSQKNQVKWRISRKNTIGMIGRRRTVLTHHEQSHTSSKILSKKPLMEWCPCHVSEPTPSGEDLSRVRSRNK